MNKSEILTLVATSLKSGTITKSDLRTIMDGHEVKSTTQSTSRLSAVDIMFYIAAIVLFAAIVALIGQSWDSGATVRIFLSAGVGTLFWTTALLLLRADEETDMRRGMTGALLLSGSLSLIAGGFIIANEFVDYTDFHFYATAITLLLLGVLHLIFGWQIKRDLITLMGVLLSVAAFPVLLFGLLSESSVPMFVNCLITAFGGGLLAYASRVASRIGLSSPRGERAFDPISAFAVLMSLYGASYDNGTGALWLFVLIAGIIGLFYLSIVMQDKLMLGNGSFFMVLAIITVSFRYFSGYGVATSLFIGAIGLIGTAMVATTINRRYIK